jgi:hypothetical protein
MIQVSSISSNIGMIYVWDIYKFFVIWAVQPLTNAKIQCNANIREKMKTRRRSTVGKS